MWIEKRRPQTKAWLLHFQGLGSTGVREGDWGDREVGGEPVGVRERLSPKEKLSQLGQLLLDTKDEDSSGTPGWVTHSHWKS